MKGIDENFIAIQEGKTKELQYLPYGMCVWAAGISPRPLTKSMIQGIPGQRNKCVMYTFVSCAVYCSRISVLLASECRQSP